MGYGTASPVYFILQENPLSRTKSTSCRSHPQRRDVASGERVPRHFFAQPGTAPCEEWNENPASPEEYLSTDTVVRVRGLFIAYFFGVNGMGMGSIFLFRSALELQGPSGSRATRTEPLSAGNFVRASRISSSCLSATTGMASYAARPPNNMVCPSSSFACKLPRYSASPNRTSNPSGIATLDEIRAPALATCHPSIA